MAQREEATAGGMTFLVVKHHSLCEESKEPREGFEPVEVFNPKKKETTTKYIDKWGAVTGFITAIVPYDTGDAYETRFQGFKIHIDDEVVVDLPQKTVAYDTFCKTCENIDYTKEVNLSAYHNKTKDRTGFSVKQKDESGNYQSVDWKYTRDNMGDCPAWEVDEDGEHDSRKQRAFLKSRVLEVGIPKCEEAAAARGGSKADGTLPDVLEAKAATATAGKSTGKKKQVAEIDDSDIPF